MAELLLQPDTSNSRNDSSKSKNASNKRIPSKAAYNSRAPARAGYLQQQEACKSKKPATAEMLVTIVNASNRMTPET